MSRARAVRPLAWAALGQGLSSLSNVLLSLALARGSGLRGLGEFSIALSAYLLVIAFQRALVTDPLLVSGRPSGNGRTEERSALTLCLAVGLIGGVVAAAVGVVTSQPQLTVLGAVLPLLTAQDGSRFVAFRRLDARAAAVIDAVWVVASAASWVPVRSGSAVLAVALWGAGAAVSLAFAMRMLRLVPAAPAPAMRWWRRDAGSFGLALGLDAGLASAAVQAATFVVAAVLGPAAVGALRSAQIVVGPAIMLLTAFSAFALPRLARKPDGVSTGDAVRASLGATVLVSPVLALGWWAGGPIARLLFGDSVELRRSILLGLIFGTLVAAATVGPVLLLKVGRRGRPLVVARLAAALIGLALVTGVALLDRVGWLGWAIAGQTTAYLAALLLILQLRLPANQRSFPAPSAEVVPADYGIT